MTVPGEDSPLRHLVASAAAAAGFDLEDLTVTQAGRRRLLRVVIDADGGVDLDAAAELSRAISDRLDAGAGGAPMGEAPYTLEVTSPGVGRPLAAPRHFRRARGRLVAVTTADGTAVKGYVLAADADGVTLLIPGSLQRRTVLYADITMARVEVEFAAPPAPIQAVLAEEEARTSPSGGSTP